MKKLISLLLAASTALSFAVIPAGASEANVVETFPYEDFSSTKSISEVPDGGLWLNSGYYYINDEALTINPKEAAAAGPAISFKNLDPVYDEYGYAEGHGADFATAWTQYDHLLKTRMRILVSGDVEGSYTSIMGCTSLSADNPNCYNPKTNLLRLEKNAGSNTYALKINTSEQGSTIPSTVVSGYEDVKVGQWINVCILMRGTNSEQFVFYIDGKEVGKGAAYSGGKLSWCSSLRFKTEGYTDNDHRIQVQYDDIALTSVKKNNPIAFGINSVSVSDQKATVKFATEIKNDIKSSLTINSESVDASRVTILSDQKTIEISDVPSDFVLAVNDGTTDVYRTAASNVAYTYGNPVPPQEDPDIIDWVTYEDFTSFDRTGWYERGNTTTLKDISGTVTVNSDGSITIPGAGDGMQGISKPSSTNGADKYLAGDSAYKLVVRAKLSLKDWIDRETSGGGQAEVSLANGYSTKQKLFWLSTNDSDDMLYARVNGDYKNLVQLSGDQWVDFAAVCSVTPEGDTWTYYINGYKITEKEYFNAAGSDNNIKASGVNSIQFAVRGGVKASFDDISAYIISDSKSDIDIYETFSPVSTSTENKASYTIVNSSDEEKTISLYYAEYSVINDRKTLVGIKAVTRTLAIGEAAPFDAQYTKVGTAANEVKLLLWDGMKPILTQKINSGLAEVDTNPFDLAQRMLNASSAEKTSFSDDGYIKSINSTTAIAKASAAAYVCSGSFKNTNFSGDDEIIVKGDDESFSTARKGFLTFDLKNLSFSGVSGAYIRLYCTDMQDSTAHFVSLHKSSGGFSEDTVTWETAPQTEDFISKSYIFAKDTWYSFDVTDYVNSCLADGKSVNLAIADNGALRTQFASRTHSYAPELILISSERDNICAPDDYDEYNGIVTAQRWSGDSRRQYLSRDISSLKGFEIPEDAPALSKYGGNMSKSHRKTGIFYTEKVNGRWIIVDPDGYEFISLGVNEIDPGSSKAEVEGRTAVYPTIEQWAEGTTNMLRGDFGFNTAGAWSDNTSLNGAENKLCTTKILYILKSYMRTLGLESSTGGNTMFSNNNTMNVFDPEFEEFCRLMIKKELTYGENGLNLIGYMSDNELPSDLQLLDRYLTLDYTDKRNVYSYVTAWEWLYSYTGKKDASLSDITDTMREDFREFVYDRYFYLINSSIKAVSPGSLYLGAREAFSSSSGILKAAGRHCDIITLNYYGKWTPDSADAALVCGIADKPFIVTEWYAMAYDSGLACTSGAGFRVDTQEDRGRFYENYALKLLQMKNCVGFHWFKYLDNDPNASGRDLSNTDGNKGLFNIKFQPYTALTNHMSKINKNAYALTKYFDERN